MVQLRESSVSYSTWQDTDRETERERETALLCIMEIYFQWSFWLPLLFTIPIILLSLLASHKFLKNKNQIPPISTAETENTSSISDSSPSSSVYEVFLSFRGEDTRKGFTDFLYTYLIGAGIHTFRDDNELRVGEEIGPELLKAIKESKISIPIFSKNYAFSKWCLLELGQMVECQANEGQMIFPIFYDVDPADVRHQSGNYKLAFRQLEKKFDEKTVQGWKDALTKVGALKGLELKKETDGHEGELVKIVVEKVLLELKKNYTHVPDNLVGIDEHINKMEGLLNSDSNGVKVVGIHGMGGLGKTTIAKVIYNQICKHFERSCFLEDVREKSQHHNGIVNLQNQLLTKILNREISNIVEVYEGINRIKGAVQGKKVFIVLDDVDEKSQIDNLAGNCDWFGAGSRIIVTTRNKDVLDALEVTCQREGLLDVYRSYEPQLMNDDHSLQLFSKYAFMRDSPPKGYYILAKEVVCTAAGLPLVLVTIGSSLFGKQDKALWEERLRKLKNIPHQQVLEKLRITFEALEYEQKQIFLDIACLFVGEDKTSPCYMWDDCEFYPFNGINVLVLRSLVKVGDDNTLRMHDQLRDLGRQIVREESLDEPGERSRLWRHEEALDLFERRMLTRKVKALCLDLRPDLELDSDIQSQCLVGGDFGQVLNLRFLRLGCADLEGDFKHLLSNLRWLQWSCEMNFTPTNFHLKNLVILDLSGSQITDDWKGWSGIKMSRKLKVLNLSHCYGLRRVTLFSTFATLERLSLSYCTSLEEIKLSSGNLINLRVLDLSNCRRLRNLDCSMFTALESLDVQWCERLRRLDGFEQLVSLKYLNMSFCRSLVRISHLPNFKKLERLDFRKCDINAYFNYWT